MTTRYVTVALPVGTRKLFSYALASSFLGAIARGARVVVPFGRKVLTGIVVDAQAARPEEKIQVREVREVLDSEPFIAPELLRTALWVAEYYFMPAGEILRALMPAGTELSGGSVFSLHPHAARLLSGGLRPPGVTAQEDRLLEILFRQGPMTSKQIVQSTGLRDASKHLASLMQSNRVIGVLEMDKPRVGAKQALVISARKAETARTGELTRQQRNLYEKLRTHADGVLLSEFLRENGTSGAAARTLERKGYAEIAPKAIERTPDELNDAVPLQAHRLTQAQQEVFEGLQSLLRAGSARRCLLHGVTGSGKTEIYLRLISVALELGGMALLLVPEIGLTPQLSRLVTAHFPGRVALLHSAISSGERFDQWQRIRAGETPVVVGTRSAVFAPLARLRLVIIDEEQDASYKQDEVPCYHAREVAWQRLLQSQGLLLMGSATPSFESYHSATEMGQTTYFRLRERIESRPLPDVRIVDMAAEFQRQGKKTVLSEALREELVEQLRRGEQSIVLLNRRGYARTLLCRSCGHVFSCPDCSISMTYHRGAARMICHYCGHESATPPHCVNCGREYIYFIGAGTEQLEEVVRSLLPEARLARVDRDTTRRRGSLRAILANFAARKLDILIGTQMLAKGHDFPHVTLVGVINGDAGLSFPDFRSAERTFQLLIQVAGRAGRGAIPGRVIIQAFCADHYALRFAQQQDYEGFFRHEREYRRQLGYPPFRSLTQCLISDRDPSTASNIANAAATALRLVNQRRGRERRMQILGPAAAPLEKLRGQYRFQILIKSDPGDSVSGLLNEAFAQLALHRVPQQKIHVDVDPLSLV
jgi:primosomal protein N' (replication factor Y)